MIKPTKLNIPHIQSILVIKRSVPYRGRTKINEIQNSFIPDMYNKIYKLDNSNRNLSDKKRLLLQKSDLHNPHWINGTYRND